MFRACDKIENGKIEKCDAVIKWSPKDRRGTAERMVGLLDENQDVSAVCGWFAQMR